jgi:hypothetical protein
MKRKSIGVVVFVAVMLSVLVAVAMAAQDKSKDKYTLKVPGGLAFSEFKGYESWQVVSISHDPPLMAAILANPVMIKAYQSGIPGNGQPFPDGSKMAKVHGPAPSVEEEACIVPAMMQEAAQAKIEVHRLRRNISILEGSGGNIAVLTGKDGKLLIEAGFGISKFASFACPR